MPLLFGVDTTTGPLRRWIQGRVFINPGTMAITVYARCADIDKPFRRMLVNGVEKIGHSRILFSSSRGRRKIDQVVVASIDITMQLIEVDDFTGYIRLPALRQAGLAVDNALYRYLSCLQLVGEALANVAAADDEYWSII